MNIEIIIFVSYEIDVPQFKQEAVETVPVKREV